MSSTINPRPRLEALDLLRGLAVAGMILVDNPGSWTHVYPQLEHAEWFGWTLADLVFPTFLFSVGMALGLSFPRVMAGGAGQLYWRRVAWRTFALIALGLLLEWTYNLAIALGAGFPGGPTLATLRLPGILQRIGLCYGAVAALVALTGRRRLGVTEVNAPALAAIAAVVLLGYWALLRFVPVPGFGAGRLDPAGNLAAYVDRAVFGVQHLWVWGTATLGGPVVYDPEGLLSTLPAATDTVTGVLIATLWVRHGRRSWPVIALAGIVLLAAGLLLDPALPINKRIFTPSFALFSSGAATLLLALFAAIWRPGLGRWLAPLRILGGNAVLAFIVNTLWSRFSGAPLLAGQMTPQHALDLAVRTIFPDQLFASLVCALVVLTAIILLLAPLHARAIHFRL